MKGVISYSLFGFNKERQDNCFVFGDYLRGLSVNIRLAELLYPNWDIILHTDQSTYDGLRDILTQLPIKITICEDAPLTKAMLWRMKPCYNPDYTHVICRDLDSPLTYREAQAVKYWTNRDKAAHAISDSISHGIPMMGGMVGFKPRNFMDYTGFRTWNALVDGKGLDYTKKGADQDLLNMYVYQCFAKHGSDSITQHYVLGMPNTFLSDCHNFIHDLELDIPHELKETNDLCGHIGAAGYYSAPMLKFVLKYKERFSYLWEIESQHKDLYYWTNENI